MRDLLRKLLANTTEPLAPDDEQQALAALMVRIARTDGVYDDQEIQTITALLEDRFDLSHEAATRLRLDAEAIEKDAPDTVRFTRAIKDHVPYEHRAQVVESLWRVVLADGHRDDDENTLMRLVANLLAVNDRDSAMARQRVEASSP